MESPAVVAGSQAVVGSRVEVDNQAVVHNPAEAHSRVVADSRAGDRILALQYTVGLVVEHNQVHYQVQHT
jgi:hypothetical protein